MRAGGGPASYRVGDPSRSVTARSKSPRLNGLASVRAAPTAMAASASIPYPELNRPEIAITGTSGCSRFSSAITTAPFVPAMWMSVITTADAGESHSREAGTPVRSLAHAVARRQQPLCQDFAHDRVVFNDEDVPSYSHGRFVG
jgi:hypothetical protein